MQALEQIQNWYNSVAAPRLQSEFAAELPEIAVGISGRGSECFGFDDEHSRDHDYALGLAFYLTGSAERKFGFRLERFYNRLRKEFPPTKDTSMESRCGGLEHGVIIIEDFFEKHLGYPGAPQTFQQWLYTPEYAFAEVINGAIFRDDAGVISRIRHSIAEDMPEDVRLKKLAARAAMMAQSGQYNYMRCIKHGEMGSAVLALDEFVRNSISMVFLLNRSFAPYYKWAFRAMKSLPILGNLSEELTRLLTENTLPEAKAEQIEKIASEVIKELAWQKLTDLNDDYLEAHAFQLMQHIHSREIAALHVMEG